MWGFAVLLFAATWTGQSGQEKASTTSQEQPIERYPFFTDAEVRLIQDYYRPGSGHSAPSAQKSKPFTKAPARGERLSVEQSKLLTDLPADLSRRLITVRDGYRRGLVGVTAVLVQSATSLVVDVAELTRQY